MSIDLSKSPATSITIQPPKAQDAKPYEYTTGKKVAATEEEFLGKDGFNFETLLDIINPLQHLPVVSTLYRQLTGDTISPGAKMLGGGLLGGITGLVASAADSIFEQINGKDMGEAVYSALTSGQQAKSEATLKTAEKIIDEKEAALNSGANISGLSESIARSRSLLNTAKDTNAALTSFAPGGTGRVDEFANPPADAPASVKLAAAKYREAQILSQQQSQMLDSTKYMVESKDDKQRKEKDGYYDGLFDNTLYKDWLSSLT